MCSTSVNRVGSAISPNSRRDAAMPPKVEKCPAWTLATIRASRVLLIILGVFNRQGRE